MLYSCSYIIYYSQSGKRFNAHVSNRLQEPLCVRLVWHIVNPIPVYGLLNIQHHVHTTKWSSLSLPLAVKFRKHDTDCATACSTHTFSVALSEPQMFRYCSMRALFKHLRMTTTATPTRCFSGDEVLWGLVGVNVAFHGTSEKERERGTACICLYMNMETTNIQDKV